MKELRQFLVVLCLALSNALLILHSRGKFTDFVIGEAGSRVAWPHRQHKVGVPQAAWPTGRFMMGDKSTKANTASSSLTAMAFLGMVVGVYRASKIVMHGQGQGGRFNYGQPWFPKLKGAKKLAVLRKRKTYGGHGARQLPIRYDVYDKLEEYDETLPWYTVLSEPADPKPSVRDAPLLERYPWAEPFKTPKEKQEAEAKAEDALEPLFGNFIYDIPPPLTRTQRYIERRGFPTYQYPPWVNKPKYDTKWPAVWEGKRNKEMGKLPFLKDRRCGNRAKDQQPEQLEAAIDDGFDDMDAVLDALDEE